MKVSLPALRRPRLLALLGAGLLALAALGFWLAGRQGPAEPPSYQRAVYSPLHFRPASETATDEQCLVCHREVLDDRPRARSPAGVVAAESKAWYQLASTYRGEQDTFHRRHLVTDLARELMDLRCNTCHLGHDPRDEAQGTSATGPARSDRSFTLRRTVDTEAACLKCHGQFPAALMGLPGPWPEHKGSYGDSCLTCHGSIRTVRHQVSYLKPAAIEAAGARDAEVCYGCHGGRAWYRISYPYPRHPWPGMPEAIPDWARGRPAASEARFIRPSSQP